MSPADSMNSIVGYRLGSGTRRLRSSMRNALKKPANNAACTLSIRAPVCWYIHHPSSYSLLNATYALNPLLEYPWFVSLPYLSSSKISRHASRRSLPSSHITPRCTIPHIRRLPQLSQNVPVFCSPAPGPQMTPQGPRGFANASLFRN